MAMQERSEDGVPSIQFVGLQLACPQCGASVALVGRLELTANRQVGVPCRVCGRCGTEAYLALRQV